MIFFQKALKLPSPLHNLIFFPKRFDKLPPPSAGVGNEELYTPLLSRYTPLTVVWLGLRGPGSRTPSWSSCSPTSSRRSTRTNRRRRGSRTSHSKKTNPLCSIMSSCIMFIIHLKTHGQSKEVENLPKYVHIVQSQCTFIEAKYKMSLVREEMFEKQLSE